MRSLEESRARWQVTVKHASSLENLKKPVKSNGGDSPCIAGLRSVCWKSFLLFQTGFDRAAWSRALVDSRSAYTSLREHLLKFIENPDELGSSLDPLDDDQNSPWNTLRQDEEMRAEIFQDVERCMPEEPYFRQPETQRILLDILFVFCKINLDVGYRQGMHELLAPILWVIEQDAIDGDGDDGGQPLEEDSLMKQTLDRACIEHDAFTLLSLIMRSAKSFYELGELDRRSSTPSTGSGTPQHGASPIVEKSKRIHEVYLAKVDPELAKHLTDIEVLPQIFLIRWIRLLFGREFPFDDLLALWDILLAEDPVLDLVDMVCVAMLLRIRWQLFDANYSVALMLLLKYPSPTPPHGPQTFVEDAIFLRDNFSAAGGATIIGKYSGRSPPVTSSTSRPSTPLGQAVSPKQKLSRTKSPLPSPARFLQQQGGVEGLFQGAAKGLFDRSEQLGINQAVRNAVEEAKKNMQGLQAPRSNSTKRRTSDIMRWSLDEGRSVPSSRPSASVSAMNARNQQLAAMLGQAMSDLRDVSISKGGDKEKYVQAMDLAIAKVDFVKVYLEDSTMPLPADSDNLAPASPSPTCATTPQSSATDPLHAISQNLPKVPSQDSATAKPTAPTKDTLGSTSPPPLSNPPSPKVSPVENSTDPVPSLNIQQATTEAKDEGVSVRPKAPLPTRSTIAQSNFAWMLEPDVSSGSAPKLPPPKPSSPFLKSGRRPTSGPSRDKAAFLFGEDREARLPSLADEDEGLFKMGTISGSKGK